MTRARGVRRRGLVLALAYALAVPLAACTPPTVRITLASAHRTRATPLASRPRGGDLLATARLPIDVVPQPRRVRREPGAFVWPRAVRVAANADGAFALVRDALGRMGIASQRLAAAGATDGADVDVRSGGIAPPRASEEYRLTVSPHGVRVRAGSRAGLFYALQTLEQMTSRVHGRFATAAAVVDDAPVYRWRGLHVDVARHFFSVATLERLIDAASHYKLNVLHLHLSDDAAWRLSSARYPALAARQRYSAADVRALTAYAARHAMIIVPELDMPAHTDAALRAYPRLACGSVLCTNGAGLAFARDVLDETAAFVSPYVHAGIDEVPPAYAGGATAFAAALQAHVAARGRRLVVWDDTLRAHVPRGAVTTVWTSRARARALASRGDDVVVASAPLYFDAAQGDPAQEPPATAHMATLREVYDAGVARDDARGAPPAHVLGAEGCLWTEHIATEDRLFAMAFPRALALAEIAWTPRRLRDWDGFLARLPSQLAWLDARGDRFRLPNVDFAFTGGDARFDAVPGRVQSVTVRTDARALRVSLAVALRGATIRYTTDGSVPSPSSRAYASAFTIRPGRRPLTLRAAAWYGGRASAVTGATVVRVRVIRASTPGSRAWASLVSP